MKCNVSWNNLAFQESDLAPLLYTTWGYKRDSHWDHVSQQSWFVESSKFSMLNLLSSNFIQRSFQLVFIFQIYLLNWVEKFASHDINYSNWQDGLLLGGRSHLCIRTCDGARSGMPVGHRMSWWQNMQWPKPSATFASGYRWNQSNCECLLLLDFKTLCGVTLSKVKIRMSRSQPVER